MQSVIYKCDTCKKPIGDRHHISLACKEFSGIACPPGSNDLEMYLGYSRWTVKEKQDGKFLHFCNADHLGNYFDDLMKKAMKKYKVKTKKK